MKRAFACILITCLLLSFTACGQTGKTGRQDSTSVEQIENTEDNKADTENSAAQIPGDSVPEGFVYISGGVFQMGSPENEAWRSDDERQHPVTVSDFYMSQYEVTQAEYQAVMNNNPSNFSGESLPVENVSWLDAVAYCNARSEREGLTPVYTIDGQNVSWERSANGYRLPTEAEWEYACRAGMTTPFYMENSPSAEEANYYGHYPYMIEDNYFSQGNLEVKPGEYRQTTVEVGSFSANPFGLYDMHGNVGEWTWDIYAQYPDEEQTDPAGAASGTRRVFFVKHFSLKKASEFPVFIRGFSLLLAGNIYASLRMSACSMR